MHHKWLFQKKSFLRAASRCVASWRSRRRLGADEIALARREKDEGAREAFGLLAVSATPRRRQDRRPSARALTISLMAGASTLIPSPPNFPRERPRNVEERRARGVEKRRFLEDSSMRTETVLP